MVVTNNRDISLNRFHHYTSHPHPARTRPTAADGRATDHISKHCAVGRAAFPHPLDKLVEGDLGGEVNIRFIQINQCNVEMLPGVKKSKLHVLVFR
jgi:hypothetical protein